MDISTITYNDVDQLSHAIKRADLEIYQLEHGQFEGTLSKMGRDGYTIDVGSYKNRVLSNATQAFDAITFAAITENGGSCQFKSKQITNTAIACLKERSETSLEVAKNTTWTLFKIQRNTLESIGFDLSTLTETLIAHPDNYISKNIINIKNLIRELDQLSFEDSILLNEHIIFDTMLSFYMDEYSNTDEYFRVNMRNCDYVAGRVYDYITSHSGYVPTLEEICLATGEQARTLQRCFKKRYNLSIWTFQKIHRLHMSRRQFILPLKDTNITKVALEHGFTHFSRFSRDYKDLFGELPSSTMKTGRQKMGIIND